MEQHKSAPKQHLQFSEMLYSLYKVAVASSSFTPIDFSVVIYMDNHDHYMGSELITYSSPNY